MSMRGPSSFNPRGGGPRFNNFSGPSGFMPMGPNQSPSGMMGPPPPFQGPNPQFDQPPFMPPNQGPQPMMGPQLMGPQREMNSIQRMPGPGFMGGSAVFPPGLPKIDPNKEIWVETLSDQGKVYFYHAKTRKSVWKKPTDENIQIITQNEAQAVAAATAAGIIPGFGMGGPGNSDEEQQTGNASSEMKFEEGEMMNDGQGMHPNEQSANAPEQSRADGNQQEHFQNRNDTNFPSNENEPAEDSQINKPPLLGPRPMQHGPMPMMGPGQMMPNVRMPGMPGFPVMPFPGMPHPMMGGPMVPRAVTVWRAHNAPDGRTYYYNITTMETQWTKPKELEEMEETARKAATDADTNMQKPDENIANNQQQMPAMMDMTGQDRMSNTQVRMDTSEVSKQPVKTIAAMTEEERQKQKQRPIASNPVPGTPWCVVWTGDEKVFFYNPTTRLSMWTRPEELRGRTDIDTILADPPHKRKRPVIVPKPADDTEDMSEDSPAKKKKKKKSVDLEEAEKTVMSNPAALPLEVRLKQFRDMLHERQVSAFSTWDKELHKIVFDPRYTLLTPKERRQEFDEYLKTRADEERKEKKAHILKTKEDFKELLEEAKITNRMTFSEFAGKQAKDPRFKAVDRMKERESLFNEFMAEAKKRKTFEAKNKTAKVRSDYMELLEEKSAGKYSRWSRVKEKISSDSRYSAVETSAKREEMWNEFCEQQKNLQSKENEESEKKRRTEESMKARLEQVEKEKAERSREIDSERQKHRLEEAIQHFKALLADMVRNTDQSWSDVKRQLRKEARWDLASLLSKDEKERHFDEHIESLNKRKRSSFKHLLEETTQIKLTSTWKEVRKLIKDDPRYSKFSSSDRKREREFEEFMKDKKVTAKSEFRNLLRETKLITHKSKEQSKNNPQHQKEILAILENDKRYLEMECLSRDREDMLYFYMDDLHRKGPPPPPTATEPSRRGLKP